MQPKTVVRTEAVIEILSFGVGAIIVILASIKETEIWSSTCTPLLPGDVCPAGATCPSMDPPSWDEGRLEMVWETIRCAIHERLPMSPPQLLLTTNASPVCAGWPG